MDVHKDDTEPQLALLQKVPIDQIQPNPDQPRKYFDEDELQELRISMRAMGQIQPIIVRPVTDSETLKDGIKFNIIDGERRWRAASMEGSNILALDILVRPMTNVEQYFQSCVANFNRAGHTPYEELLMIYTLVDVQGHSQNSVAGALGKSYVWVNQRYLAWKRLNPNVMARVRKGDVPITVATKLAKLVPEEQQKELMKYLEGGSLSNVMVAVRKATDSGKVQGTVRKPDLRDDRRYIVTSVRQLTNRFIRLNAIGSERISLAAEAIPPDEREQLLNDLFSAGKEIVKLMKALKVEYEE